MISYGVAQRFREIGIRMALGARKNDVMWLVMRQGGRLALIGVGIGIAGAFAGTRLMSSFLFAVTTTDPVTYAAVSIVLVVVALVACYLPARSRDQGRSHGSTALRVRQENTYESVA